MSKTEIVDHIVTILHRYDVVLIQEVRDKSQESITQLLQRLNDDIGDEWAMIKSDRHWQQI